MRTSTAVVSLVLGAVLAAPANAADTSAIRTLDGSGNNVQRPQWGKANTPYRRIAPPSYADGIGKPFAGPPARYISNRIFNDTAQNVFSENGITQWGFAWGQFIDHAIGLRQDSTDESSPIQFNASDPLESFHNDLGAIAFTRTPAAPGTGVSSPRQQINTVSSYIDASNVYGDDAAREEWLRAGSVDGVPENNSAKLLLPDGLLPRVGARGDGVPAPAMALSGRLLGSPADALVAGDVRANENIALTATQTLFAREHNRIVDTLPHALPDEQKFQIARRVVGAEQQYITYREFLPALGVTLSPYRGYDPRVNASLSNEFATVGYRAHSMVHGELEPTAPAGTYSDAQLAAFERQGLEVEDGGEVKLVAPLNLTFENPRLLASVGVGPVLKGLGAEREYRNDEQIDNQMRSILFQVPKPGVADPSVCLDGPSLPDCFSGVVDLGAIDVERGRDHGMPSYNALRRAYGLSPKASFTAITGERTERFPSGPAIARRDPIDDPSILDVLKLFDAHGNEIPLGSPAADTDAIREVRRTTVAARLKAIYGDVDRLDAFVGMVSERHVTGTELGELQRAIWTREFETLRDGDRFFYGNDRALADIQRRYGITYRHTLAEVIRTNTDADVRGDVFHAAD
ncbi:MAG TPA: peroxidase family protein [Conexibacter sp.]|nr:peroxidase family protein [Conexibacter sp.]